MLLQPVVEVVAMEEDFGLWPVDTATPRRSYVRLSGSTSPQRVGSVLATLAWGAVPSSEPWPGPLDASEAIGRLLDEPDQNLVLQGGLRIVAAGGRAVDPGCCCWIEEWRQWFDVFEGGRPDLGHGVGPLVEHRGDVIRIWLDADDDGPRADSAYVDTTRAELRSLLAWAHRDLVGFHRVLGEWATTVVPELATVLQAGVDRHWVLTAPLPPTGTAPR